MSLQALAALGAGGPVAVHASTRKPPQSVDPVHRSAELERILCLPRKSTTAVDVSTLVCRPQGKMSLRPIQHLALHELRTRRGLFAPIAVGGGKTLIAALAGTVLDAGPTVVLTTAGLVKQARSMMMDYALHFYLRRDVRWLSYGILSSPQQFEILERLKPQVLVLDECQNVANPDAARTKRLERYLEAHPGTIVACLSGTVTRKSIKDYTKLLRLSLNDWTPLPRDWKTTQEWAEALDVSDRPRPPGALAELVQDDQLAELVGTRDPRAVARGRVYIDGAFLRAPRWESPEFTQIQQLARDAVRRRLTDSHGVVASSSNDLPCTLTIEVVRTPPCPKIEATLGRVLDMWERPDGELITFGLELARVARHVRLGGFYRWVWPKSVTRDAIAQWLEVRRAFRSDLREFLREHASAGIDSPFLVEGALKRGEIMFPTWEPWCMEREEMRARIGAPMPATEWVWVSKVVVEDAAARVSQEAPCIGWTETTAIGEEIAKLAKIQWMGAGELAQRAILDEKGERSIIASVKAHGTGRNLQAFNTAMVVGAPSSGATWEQLLGRLHRPGQEADVRFRLYDAFSGELKSAMRDAHYIEATTGNAQKLLTAELIGLERRKT